MKRVLPLAAAIVLAVPASAFADATVDGSKGQKIQPAVDAAAAGDTITVLPASYAEDVSVPSGKDGLKLVFQPGAALAGSLSVASNAVKVGGLVLFRSTGTGPALNAKGGLALTDSTIFATTDDAASFTGAGNVIQRSTLLTTAAADGADGVALSAGDLTADSSIVVGGAKGTGFRVTAGEGSGDAALTLNHVTTTSGLVLEGAGSVPLLASDDITVKVNASIVHGASTATGDPGTPPLQPANAVSATFTNSDASKLTLAGGATSTGDGTVTADDAIFKAGSALRLKFNSAVIDKGGPVASGESATDIDGDPRTNGAATDIGADEFTNAAPELSFAITPDAPKTGQIVTATGTASDKNGADDIIGYAVDWGDGKKDTTASNVIQHVYDTSGTYTVTMLVADQSFATSAVVSKQITVTDGAPPQLQVTTPKPGAIVKLTRKKKKGAKKAPKPKPFLIKGVDADESGLSSVELAITRTGSKCKQYTGSRLKRAGCTKYTFVKATLKGTGFSLKARRLAKGSYEIRARGTDTKGNATSTFDEATKTLVKFKVR